jgi:hypothetical protein
MTVHLPSTTLGSDGVNGIPDRRALFGCEHVVHDKDGILVFHGRRWWAEPRCGFISITEGTKGLKVVLSEPLFGAVLDRTSCRRG